MVREDGLTEMMSFVILHIQNTLSGVTTGLDGSP